LEFDADYVYKAINALPLDAHPMTQFTTGVMALQVMSHLQIEIQLILSS